MKVNDAMRAEAALKIIRACFAYELTVKFHQHEVEVFDEGECINSRAISNNEIPEDVALQAIYECVSVPGMDSRNVFG